MGWAAQMVHCGGQSTGQLYNGLLAIILHQFKQLKDILLHHAVIFRIDGYLCSGLTPWSRDS
jgi:hypothetical protein